MENPYINSVINPGLGAGVAAAINTNFINVETAFGEIVDSLTATSNVASRDTVISGLAVATDTDLYVTVALGEAVISGERVIKASPTSLLLTATKNNFIYLSSAGVLSSTAQTIDVEEPAVPANKICIAMVVTGASAVTKIYDKRDFCEQNVPMKFTPEGGLAIYVKVNETIVRGEILEMDAADANLEFSKISAGGYDPAGIAYEDIAKGSRGWMVVAGLAHILPKANAKLTKGNHVIVSTTVAGRADGSASVNSNEHWNEVGHCCETSSANGVAARCIVHFN